MALHHAVTPCDGSILTCCCAAAMDLNHDGRISWQEFQTFFGKLKHRRGPAAVTYFSRYLCAALLASQAKDFMAPQLLLPRLIRMPLSQGTLPGSQAPAAAAAPPATRLDLLFEGNSPSV